MKTCLNCKHFRLNLGGTDGLYRGWPGEISCKKEKFKSITADFDSLHNSYDQDELRQLITLAANCEYFEALG